MSSSEAASMVRTAYASFAERYAEIALTKPHNALYERPATRELLGSNLHGLHVLDAGCGPGINSAWLAQHGATVHGIDVTPEMIALARKRCEGMAATFDVQDLAQPFATLDDGRFDVVLSALALDYVEDLAPTFREFARVARPGATLVWSMAHPMRDWLDERTHRNRPYFETTRFGMYWSGFGEPKPFVQSFRRPLADILNAAAGAGWQFERMVEPRPQPEMKRVDPRLYGELSQVPAFLCVRARRAPVA
ncbi:class I SAM-dependent methyltransferase [Pandoraea nosoerga]|uniref:Methylase n=1 Tax=Pandoraea nosoerga TaxID=2508296 RepID=A0A5E4SIY3_9BURK|nr:class I SAM-dependent methyltransferase [Pandoraea nosoerga]MBN4665315.1 class I SAM-dependent methyltransferase [Pandoraea nosoerga]MBN4674715.1 class I SAM-dependent methyltransferase [Pandoraea nosoerga]MBN4680604.1 class I SAM-dependent methyltransferase [Pandoraea nosoerga]MBN4744009.1 class I SAM-dependent methyltransferase [Pandoraea nosoerga]VVD74742.1 methylase [Pandoraea nosoerga]